MHNAEKLIKRNVFHFFSWYSLPNVHFSDSRGTQRPRSKSGKFLSKKNCKFRKSLLVFKDMNDLQKISNFIAGSLRLKPKVFFRMKIYWKITFLRFPLWCANENFGQFFSVLGGVMDCGQVTWNTAIVFLKTVGQERKIIYQLPILQHFCFEFVTFSSAIEFKLFTQSLFLKVFYKVTKISIYTNKIVFLICCF